MFSTKRRFFLFVFFLFVFSILSEWLSVSPDDLRKDYFSLKYSGVVANKYIDKENHAYRIIDFKDKTRITIPSNSYELFEHIVIGDSLKKDSGSLLGFIIKKDTTLIIDYEKSIPKED